MIEIHESERPELTLKTATPAGLHGFVAASVLQRYAHAGVRALDLGSGPGAIATRLQSMGCSVLAVDLSREGYEASAPLVSLDLNLEDFASSLGLGLFDLITAIEVIEHVESPIGFLRNIGKLIAPSGVAVITTPNVDSVLARFKFFATGRIRTMDEGSDPTHISPIYLNLLERQFLPRAGLRLREYLSFPPDGFQLSRWPVRTAMRAVAAFASGKAKLGDHHVLVLDKA